MQSPLRTALVLGAGAVLWLATSQALAAKKFELKFQPGQVYAIEMVQQTKQTINVMGQNQEMPMTMTMGMTWKVDKANADGTLEMTQTINRVQMTMNLPGQGEIKYDSSVEGGGGPLGAMLGGMLKPMLKAEFHQTMNRQGKILKVSIPDEALSGMNNNPMLKEFFSKEALGEMMAKVSPVLPEQAIDKGYSWDSKAETAAPFGKMVVESKYTYEGEEQRGDKTLDKFSVNIKLDLQMTEGSAAALKVEDQTSSGTLYFDAAAGYFVENSIKQEMTMSGKMADQEFKLRQDTVTKLTTKPAK